MYVEPNVDTNLHTCTPLTLMGVQDLYMKAKLRLDTCTTQVSVMLHVGELCILMYICATYKPWLPVLDGKLQPKSLELYRH